MPNTQSQGYKRCTILLEQSVYNRLRQMGRFGESFSDVVSRLMDESEEANRDGDLS